MASFTSWTRLEPRTRDGDLRDGLSAAVHDPLWLLGRQWQTGELQGEDGGSLVDVAVELAVDRMARGRPGGVAGTGTDTVFSDQHADPPLEALVERETVRPQDADGPRDCRLAAEAGSHFLRILSGTFQVDASEFPDDVLLSAPDETDEATARYTSVVGGRVLDGDALLAAYDFADFASFETAVVDGDLSALPASLDLPAADSDTRRDYWDAVERYRAWYEDLYTEGATDAWDGDRQEYTYAVSTGSGPDETVLEARGYEGGRLDWYDFDVASDATLEPDGWSGPSRETHEPPHGTTDVPAADRDPLVPSTTSFEGMPAERWWEFEDDGVNLSALEAAPEDLSKLLLTEFALVYGNDWFTMPVDLPVGSLSRVESFELTTTFGETVTVDDAVVTGDDPTTAWNVYSLSLSADGDERGLFLAPTVVETIESDAVESVEFARDEAANVGWAVESTIEGGVGQPRDRDEELAGAGDGPPVATSEGTDVAYRLASAVPDNWYPLLPRRRSLGDVTLELGRLLTDDGPVPDPSGEILSGDLSMPEEELSRTGQTVDRRYALTRTADGSTYLWGGRAVEVGSGDASSGLSFDDLVDPRAPTAEDPVGDPEPFPDGEPVTPTGRLEVTATSFQTPGGPREHLDEETVTLSNVGRESLDVSDWRVTDAAGHDYVFAEGTVLPGGSTLTLHTGAGTDSDTDRYWGREQAVWNDLGDTVHVFDAAGALALMRHVPERPVDVDDGPLVLAAVVADPTGTGSDPTEESLVFENATGGPLSLAGWYVEDAVGHRYTFPDGTELAADASVTLTTGVGEDTGSTYFWGRGSAVWNNSGDTVSVFDADGGLVLRHSY